MARPPSRPDAGGAVPTILRMLESLQALVAPAALQRLTLVLNHVLAAEPVAVARLKPHAGRCIGLQMSQWPSLLPPPPAIVFCITRAGLLEWVEQPDAAVPDLHVSVAAGNPAAVALGLLAGARPPIAIQGDAALAADVNWLADNLRWDVAADLERLFGPAVAHQLAGFGRTLAEGLRRLVQAGGSLAAGRQPR
jgi:ubiquinone biosynthesis accessory factor UbiJ